MTPPPTSTLADTTGSTGNGFGLALAALAVIAFGSLGITLRYATIRTRR